MLNRAEGVLRACRERGWRLATAESCTGGLIAGRLTDVAGSSDVVEGGIVAYANAVKTNLLGVPPDVLAREGAVSEAVARAMATGCRAALSVEVGIAVTGIAGPGGATPGKPVGLVHLAVATPDGITHLSTLFPGDRSEIRRATVDAALDLTAAALSGSRGR